MLEKNFAEIYTKFKLSLYTKVFSHLEGGKNSLSAVEVFCLEVIYALGRPTVNEFATFAQISPPNAAYKVNQLIKKGYLLKVRNEDDKRAYHLEVTEKYMHDYGITYDYMNVVMNRICERFSPEDVEKLEEMMDIIGKELMPEVTLGRKFD